MGGNGCTVAGEAPELVIFDCDGVLVDSEMLAAGVLIGLMGEEGFPISEEVFRTDFLGRSFTSAQPRVVKRFGRPLPEGFEQRYRARLFARLAAALTPMPGAAAVLRGLTIPYCLATGSSPQRLAVSLAATALAGFFAGRAFTASEVAHGKPAPDLFLHAAARMGADPRRCLVVEDSEAGIRAARAAGMAVWHFTGGSHVRAGYAIPAALHPDAVVASMAELGARLEEMGLFSGITPA